ncbi:MAG: hypothetical protein CML13_07870 [Puniceicoccaceae bacterium]|nr:hypothetical protein [Puniceicoccaceae bacterium]|tara:strand:- start:27089 stop:27409 length:321 start_codon:yes stop_codon:yes gene_type:complete
MNCFEAGRRIKGTYRKVVGQCSQNPDLDSIDCYFADQVSPVQKPHVLRHSLGQAVCEAVVQRVPEPVYRSSEDPSDPDFSEPDINEAQVGRRFIVTSLRWLGQEEI